MKTLTTAEQKVFQADASIQENSAVAQELKKEFPIFEQYPELIYVDNGATSQKPRSVLEAEQGLYTLACANVHRAIYSLGERATGLYEDARKTLAAFIGASPDEIVFTRGTTEAINLVAHSFGETLSAGDEIILTEMEHHSNLVPWQILAAEKDVRLEFIPVRDDFRLDLEEYQKLLALKPKLVAFTQMSNVLGTINPAKEIIRMAHDAGALTLIDGAQSVPHFPVDVQDLDADFLAFSAHKMCGPTGIGVLYGSENLLESMPPFLGGGDMIRKVLLRSFSPNELPHKFEAGTPAIAEAIGFGVAVDYLKTIGMDVVAAHEREITAYALDRLSEIPGLEIYGPAIEYKGGVVSFTLRGIHPHDVAQLLDRDGIAVRAGHHCAMPLHQKFNLPATTRASFYLYTTLEEIDQLVRGLENVVRIFG
uniref:cysteine desulfurase n=1 Tax=Anaerolinea thermolimosa TaxID=229919 RepID=A0A7C4PKL6_9CHLR